MTDEPKAAPQIGQAEISAAVANANAPLLYFEDVPHFGILNGVGQITLTASRIVPDAGGKSIRDQIIVAHLRGNIVAVRSLRAALDGILQMIEPVPEGPIN